MKSVNTILFLVFAAAAAPAQQFASGNCTTNQFRVSYRTVLEPAPPDNGEPHKPSGLASRNDDCFRHLIADPKLKQYVAYSLRIEPHAAGGFKATFEPVNLSPEEAIRWLVPDFTGWSQITISKFPEPQEIRDGDTIAVDLLVNPTTGQKMVDYLTVTGVPNEKSPKFHWIDFHAPQFPARAEGIKLQGTVVLQYDFSPDNPNPIRTISGHPILVQASLESLRQSKFRCVNCDENLHTVKIEYVFKRADAACDNAHDSVTVDGNRVTIVLGGACGSVNQPIFLNNSTSATESEASANDQRHGTEMAGDLDGSFAW